MKFKISIYFCLSLIIFSACFSQTDRGVVKEYRSDKEIGILAGGDVMLDWGIGEVIDKEGYVYPFAGIKDFLSSFDFRYCNLECPVSAEGEPHPVKKYIFLAKPEYIESLVYGGIDGVSLANNHTSDFGKSALINTMTILSQKGIMFTGAGMDVGSAHLPISINKRGIKCAIFAYSFIAESETFATHSSPGIAGAGLDLIKEDIQQFRALNNFIIVSIHWGIEYSDYPLDDQIEIAHAIIDAGADAVIGHHSHIFQGVEIYRNRPVFYSLGNFLFGSINEDIRDNILVELRLMKNGIVSIGVYPLNGNKNTKRPFQPALLEGDGAGPVLRHLINISRQLGNEFPDKAVIEDSHLVYYFNRN
jgi:poly-gamma-glutamate synthesis protein (capsule biosynthesis protein)